jgi:hypothetical protein
VSAAALRAPAPWHRVEAAALLRPRAVPVVLAAIVLLTTGPFGAGTSSPFMDFIQLTTLMFFFPLLLWRGRGGRGSLDAAMPVGTATYALIRIGLGAAAALAVMCIVTQVHLLVFVSRFTPSQLSESVRDFSAAITLRGLAVYLLGCAIVIRARRPGRVLLVVFLMGLPALLMLGIGDESTGWQVLRDSDGGVETRLTSSLTVGKALLQLAVAAAALGVSVWMGERGRGLFLPWQRAGRTAPALRTTSVPRAARSIPRSPASMGAVAMRQLAVQAPRMAWPMLVLALLALRYVAGGMGLFGLSEWNALYVGSFFFLWLTAFLWPLLVWMDERGGRPWDEAQPVDAFRRRLLHWAAGLAWLEACVLVLLAGHVAGAAAAGTLASAAWLPAWVLPGVPLAVMALYCIGTVPAVLSAHPVRGSVFTLLVVGPALQLLMHFTTGRGSPISLVRLLAPVQASDNHQWSLVAALVWIPLFAALAVLALRHRANVDRGGRAHRPVPVPA